jgi:hypothetical protein
MEAQHKSPWIIDSFTEHETRRELAKRTPLMTIEEFKAAREQGTLLSSQPVVESQPAENFTDEPILISPSQEQAAIDMEVASKPPHAEPMEQQTGLESG